MAVIKIFYFFFIMILSRYWSYIKTQQNPVIAYITKERIVDIGDTIDLQCSVLYVQNHPVKWIKLNDDNYKSNLIISIGSNIEIPDPRFSINHAAASNTYILQIKKIQETDAGLYQCNVDFGINHKISANVWVHVRTSPKIRDNNNRLISTSIGNNITLQCYANGYPTSQITWRKENSELLPTGGEMYRGNLLPIFNITKDDRGIYYCIADNGIAEKAYRKNKVEVEFTPIITAECSHIGQALQYDINLVCRIEAFPSPSILWLKDGLQLQDNEHYQIYTSTTYNEFTETVLRIISIKKHQYGKYICRAINKLGQTDAIVELYETSHPSFPNVCE